MNRSEYSYLDLTVMPFLRRKVISSDAAILFDGSISKVLWANAVGTELFGGNGIYSLLNLELSDKHSLVRQLRNAARQISDHEPVMRGFRVARGLKSDLMQGELTKIPLPNGEETLLLVIDAQAKAAKMREHELAVMAVDALEGFADASAIVDEYGLVLASSAGFDTLDIDADTLETLIQVVAREDDRLVKRKIEIGSGHHAAAGLGRIRDTPGRFLIVVADTDFSEEESTNLEPINEDENPDEQAGLLLSDSADDFPDEVDGGQLPPWLSNGNLESEAKADDELINEKSGPSDSIDDKPLQVDDEMPVAANALKTESENEKEAEPDTEKQAGSLLDRWYFSDRNENNAGEAIDEAFEPQTFKEENSQDRIETSKADYRPDFFENSDRDENRTQPILESSDGLEEVGTEALEDTESKDTRTSGQEKSQAVEPHQPRRFAFSVDRFQVIKSVSPELAASVGEISGDILEKHWKAISNQRGFDTDNVILNLLEKADTWSGKSVLWPVDDTDMVVPVDLAALPVFDRERNFDGFRGFGVIRMDDAIVDPNGIGFKLAEADNFVHDETTSADEEENTPYRPVWTTDIEGEDQDYASEPAMAKVEESAPEKVENQDSASESPKADNVFQLPSGRNKAANKSGGDTDKNIEVEQDRLSGREQQAFSEISRSLNSATQQAETEKDANSNDAVSEAHDDKSDMPQTTALTSEPLLETLPVPLFVYRAEKTLFANEALLELTGYKSTQEIADAGGVEALLSDRDNLNDPDAKGVKLITKDGKKVSVRSRLTSISWENDKALCLTFAELAGEETSGKAALDLVRVSELENILETAADGILVIDQDGKIESLNASGEALFGIEQKAVLGRSFGKLFATESRQALESYIRDLNAPGVSGVLNQGQQVIGLEAGGGLIPLFATIGKVGSTGRYCAVLRDLTQWKKNEEELVEAKRNAETASEQKSEFLSRISHEIREPLTAIIGFSDVMIEERFGKIDNERYREYLKDINRSGIHVLDLVNDLLDISKIEAGKLELSYEAVDLNQLAAETVALLQPQANNKRILIRTSLSRAVPKVVADARSIRQIILNLVSNAINHSPKNSQVIVSTTFEENSEVGLRIRDTGEGMSKEELERALQPFAQVGSNKNGNQTGSGLGLPLTKALIEANRAYFELESTPGEGTIAHIQFPSQRVLAD